MLGNDSAHLQHAIAKADFAGHEKLINLLVNAIALFKNKAIAS